MFVYFYNGSAQILSTYNKVAFISHKNFKKITVVESNETTSLTVCPHS